MQKPKPSSATEVRGGFSVPQARTLCSAFWWLCQCPVLRLCLQKHRPSTSWLWSCWLKVERAGPELAHSFSTSFPISFLGLVLWDLGLLLPSRTVGLNCEEPSLIAICSSMCFFHASISSLALFYQGGYVSQDMYFCFRTSNFQVFTPSSDISTLNRVSNAQ